MYGIPGIEYLVIHDLIGKLGDCRKPDGIHKIPALSLAIASVGHVAMMADKSAIYRMLMVSVSNTCYRFIMFENLYAAKGNRVMEVPEYQALISSG